MHTDLLAGLGQAFRRTDYAPSEPCPPRLPDSRAGSQDFECGGGPRKEGRMKELREKAGAGRRPFLKTGLEVAGEQLGTGLTLFGQEGEDERGGSLNPRDAARREV
jgi:hypothetical protein